MRRTMLRAKRPMRRWTRQEEDKVTSVLRDYILLRDRMCVASQIDPIHQCQGRDDTLDHVPGDNENALGKRAPSDARHLVRLCLGANVNGWASAHRAEERAWIAVVEG